jgi:hypothetical protein
VNVFKKPHISKKSLHFFENVFKKPKNLPKCPTLMEKASISLKKI